MKQYPPFCYYSFFLFGQAFRRKTKSQPPNPSNLPYTLQPLIWLLFLQPLTVKLHSQILNAKSKGYFFQTLSSLAVISLCWLIPPFWNYCLSLVFMMSHFPGFPPTSLVIPSTLLLKCYSSSGINVISWSFYTFSPWVFSVSQKLQLPPICGKLICASHSDPSSKVEISTANYLLYISTCIWHRLLMSTFPKLNYVVVDNNFLDKMLIISLLSSLRCIKDCY